MTAPPADTKVICVGNQKGGVGKTTNTINLAGALHELGRRSLIIDLDMTSGATKSLRAPTEGWYGTFDLLSGAEPTECIITDKDTEVKLPPGVHLIPSSRNLNELDTYLANNKWVVHQDLLMGPIEKLRGIYDYIWLDTPPQTTKTTIPALKVADFVILSCMPDQLAVQALTPAVQDILDARQGPNSGLVLLGVAMNAMPNPMTRLARSLVNDVDAACPNLRFETSLKRTVVLQEATKKGQTIFQYEPTDAIADAYRRLAREVEERIARIEAERDGVTSAVEPSGGEPSTAAEEAVANG